MVPAFAFAEETPGLLIQKSDGSQVELRLSEIRSIKFGNGQMIVNGKDSAEQVFRVDDISKMTFCDIITAIKSLSCNAESGEVIVTDLSGKVVYKGKSGSVNVPTTLKGTFIITVDGQSHKVTVK